MKGSRWPRDEEARLYKGNVDTSSPHIHSHSFMKKKQSEGVEEEVATVNEEVGSLIRVHQVCSHVRHSDLI